MNFVLPSVSRSFTSDSESVDPFILDIPGFSFPSGKKIFVVGSNGSGKSLYLRSLAGDKIDGFASDENTRIRFQEETCTAVLVRQNPEANLAMDMSGVENFVLWSPHRKSFFENFDLQTQDWILKYFPQNMISSWQKPIRNLSGGQKQALSIATRLYSGNRILLLDEFTSAIDIQTSESLMKAICSYIIENAAMAMIVTHDIQQAARHADAVLVFSKGKVFAKLDLENIDDYLERRQLVMDSLDKAYESQLDD